MLKEILEGFRKVKETEWGEGENPYPMYTVELNGKYAKYESVFLGYVKGKGYFYETPYDGDEYFTDPEEYKKVVKEKFGLEISDKQLKRMESNPMPEVL